MSTLSRNNRFQIHLSTAIVLMFVAGSLLALNLRPNAWHPRLIQCMKYCVKPEIPVCTTKRILAERVDGKMVFMEIGVRDDIPAVFGDGHYAIDQFGFPFVTAIHRLRPDCFDKMFPSTRASQDAHWTIDRVNISLDIGFGIGVLLAIAIVCEYLTRRRKMLKSYNESDECRRVQTSVRRHIPADRYGQSSTSAERIRSTSLQSGSSLLFLHLEP